MKLQRIQPSIRMSIKKCSHYLFELPFDLIQLPQTGTDTLPIASILCLKSYQIQVICINLFYGRFFSKISCAISKKGKNGNIMSQAWWSFRCNIPCKPMLLKNQLISENVSHLEKDHQPSIIHCPLLFKKGAYCTHAALTLSHARAAFDPLMDHSCTLQHSPIKNMRPHCSSIFEVPGCRS